VSTEFAKGGTLLRERRRALNLSQQDVAAKVRCADTYVSLIEVGDRRPSFGTIETFALVLQLNVDEVCCAFGIVPPDVAALVMRDKATLDAVRGLLKG
jgi:transcriptional regulator with XRE-family HTH domain